MHGSVEFPERTVTAVRIDPPFPFRNEKSEINHDGLQQLREIFCISSLMNQTIT